MLRVLFFVFRLLRLRSGRGKSWRPAPKIDPRAVQTGTGQKVQARVSRVMDGDTVDVAIGHDVARVRLSSIDCPEIGQPWGNTAKYGLVKLIGGKKIYLEIHGVDPYSRILATIFVPKSKRDDWMNVNERMVILGHAWVTRQFYDHLPKERRDSLNRIETWAKSRKVGLWKKNDPVPPWEWRAINRKR